MNYDLGNIVDDFINIVSRLGTDMKTRAVTVYMLACRVAA